MIENPIEELNRLKREKWQAEKKLNDRFAELYPPGTKVSYRHGRTCRTVQIIRPCGERVRVRGESGSEYFIYHASIWIFGATQDGKS